MFMGEYNSGGIVGVLAKELSRDEIFYGIKERRYTGATSPDRILIEFTINGKGLVNNSEITLPRVNIERNINCSVAGTAPIEKITLLKINK